MFPISHKSVFVLDENPLFVSTTCQEQLDFDKSRPGGLPAISKSLWTCAVESVAEYCRIIWDLYPDGERLISFARCRPNRHALLSWSEEDQSLPALMRAFIDTSRQVTAGSSDSDLLVGLRAAVAVLGQESDAQRKAAAVIQNRGRILCLSYFRSDAQIMGIQEKVAAFVEEHNALVRSNNNNGSEKSRLLTVDQAEVVFINTHPLNDNTASSRIVHIPLHQVAACLTCEVHSTGSGTLLAQKMLSLALKQFNLSSTTVTGIPMKEEQNASSSANYDVEIVHPEEVHQEMVRSGVADSLKVPKEGCEYTTIPLKWCTPRSNAVELHYTLVACRVTPVDVNSRPSNCLSNFLLAGRTVMLEMVRPKNKVMSHMLSSHNSELYIHTLASARSILEDPPSISEGTGGRVTDYRINDFGEFMRSNRLVRCDAGQVPCASEKAKHSLCRQTVYWPIVIGNTIIFNLQQYIQQLLDLIPKDKLSVEEVNDCKSAVYTIVNLESKGVNLTVPGLQSKGKGPKREELYKLLYRELTHFVANFAATPEHQQVLSCLNDVHSGASDSAESLTRKLPKPQSEAAGSSSKSGGRDAAGDLQWKEVSHFNGHSPDSPTSIDRKKQRTTAPGSGFDAVGPEETLLSFWTKRLAAEASRRHPEFAGRLESGSSIAPLYLHMNEKTADQT